MLFTNLQHSRATEELVMNKQDFKMFQFERSFERISWIATLPRWQRANQTVQFQLRNSTTNYLICYNCDDKTVNVSSSSSSLLSSSYMLLSWNIFGLLCLYTATVVVEYEHPMKYLYAEYPEYSAHHGINVLHYTRNLCCMCRGKFHQPFTSPKQIP